MNIAAESVRSAAGLAQFIGVIMGNSGEDVSMVTWADADAAVEAERAQRLRRVENTTLLTALSLLVCAVWLAWPSIKGLMSGDGAALTTFGAPLLLLIWGIFVQDLTLDDAVARSALQPPPPWLGQFCSVWGLWGLTTVFCSRRAA